MEEISNLLIGVLSGLFALGATWFGSILKKVHINYRSKKFKLNQHTLFSSILNYDRKINTWNIEENRQVFIDAFSIKLKKWHSNFLILAEELQTKSLNNSNLEKKIINCANKTIRQYIKEWEENLIPLKVIKKINEQYNTNIEAFMQRISKKAHNNDMYTVYMQKTIAIFDVLELLLSETIDDLNDFIFRKNMNGYYHNIKYKGVPINDDEFKKYLKIKYKN